MIPTMPRRVGRIALEVISLAKALMLGNSEAARLMVKALPPTQTTSSMSGLGVDEILMAKAL